MEGIGDVNREKKSQKSYHENYPDGSPKEVFPDVCGT